MSETETSPNLIKRPDGSYIDYKDVEPRQQLGHDLVSRFFPEAEALSDNLKALKKSVLSEMHAYRWVMMEDYGLQVGRPEGGFSLKTIDGLRKIEMSVSKHISFGPEIEAAKELLMQFLADELEGSSNVIQEIFNKAFKLSSTGRLDTGGILGLKTHRFDHPLWNRAMDAIDDALVADSSTVYVRFYNVDPENKQESLLPLDIAKV